MNDPITKRGHRTVEMGLRLDEAPRSSRRRQAFAASQFRLPFDMLTGGLLSAQNHDTRFDGHNGCPHHEFSTSNKAPTRRVFQPIFIFV